MKFNRVLWSALLLALIAKNSFAYEQPTHRRLSEAAVGQSILAQQGSILSEFGLTVDISKFSQQRFPNSKGKQQSIIQLIEDGADFEDAFPRPIHHFYDPDNDQSLQKPFISVFTHPSPDWALEDTSDINGQDNSYKHAVDAFYKALTLPTKTERDTEWGKVFETLGNVIHHIQDMAQPEHVRNDAHCGEFWGCGLPGAIIGIYDPSLFEKHSLKVFKDGIPTGLVNYPVVTFPTSREFWTTRATDPIATRRGLADFTNRNFVSKDSNFELKNGTLSANSRYNLPVPSGSNIVDMATLDADGAGICQRLNQVGPIDLPPNSLCKVEFIENLVTDSYNSTQSTNTRAASLSIFDQYLQAYNVTTVSMEDGDGYSMVDVDRLPTINTYNIDSAHTYLIPRAVAYGAGLIDHFFRGKIDMEANPNGTGWVIKNLTDQDMQGDFTLYYDHIQNINGQNITTRSPVPGASWPALFVPANSEVVVGSYTEPTEFLGKMLVFDGVIGIENAIAGKILGGWAEPLSIGPAASVGNSSVIAIDGEGNSLVGYYTYDAITEISSLWSHLYTSQGGWGGETLIKNSQWFSINLAIAMNDIGDAMIVYGDVDPNNSENLQLLSRRYTKPLGWSVETLINDILVYGSGFIPGLDMDPSSNAIFAYRDLNPSAQQAPLSLWSRNNTPTGGWNSAELIDHYETLWVGNYKFDIAIGPAGSAMLVYSTFDSATRIHSLWSRHYTPAGGWGTAILVDSNSPMMGPDPHWTFFPSLAMNEAGNAMLTYRKYDDTTTANQWVRHYTPTGGWEPASVIHDSKFSHNDLFKSYLDMDAAGNAIIFYRNFEFTGELFVKHYTPSVGWGETIELAAPTQVTYHVFPMAIDMSENGRAVVLWRDWYGKLYSRHYTP